MPFIHDDFLLSTDTARQLFHEHAIHPPIIDYHCHLPPADLAEDRTFDNLFDVWLAGDHYKWRAMRANGVPERFCTGEAEPYEKFMAWAKTVPHTLRNPLYHWTHLELKRYFDIDVLLSENTGPEVWEAANAKLRQMSVGSILDKFKVALIGTTDDPNDLLEHHKTLAEQDVLPHTAVYPAFRPDKSYQTDNLDTWNAYVDRLEKVSGIKCHKLDGFLDALRQRHAFFHDMGSRLSDHGLTHLPAVSCSEKSAKDIFKQARDGKKLTDKQRDKFLIFMMLFFGELDHAAGWTKQLHLGAMRNNNAWAYDNLGPDTGFDSIGDYPQGPGLSHYLGTLAGRQQLPKTILYNLNPADNYLFATMIGNYQGDNGGGEAIPGKMQFGSGWWFLDQLEGMTWQLNALSNLGLLTRFVGMLTDSRSFLSFPRHEYFRRLLCELLGKDVEAGRLPDDIDELGRVVENICFHNARDYFGMALKGRHA